jgi:hypothetical protein
MLYLNLYELTNSAAELINYLEHKLMAVIVNAVKKLLQFIDGQVPDNFPETFILFCRYCPLFKLAFHLKCEIRGFYKPSGILEER